MTRKARRAIAARTQKLYSLDGTHGQQIAQAYEHLSKGRVQQAVQCAYPVSEEVPHNPHAWVILGTVALAQREGDTAKSFFLKAIESDGKNAVAHAGLGKAMVLQADVFEAVIAFEDAITFGSKDVQMAQLLCDLMERMGRLQHCADLIKKMATKNRDATLHFRSGEMYAAGEFFLEAAEQYNIAFKLSPHDQDILFGKIKADMFTHFYDEVISRGEAYLRKYEKDAVVPVLMNAYRVKGRHEDALALCDSHAFDDTDSYRNAVAIKANIAQDLGLSDEADDFYQQALLMSRNENSEIARAFGAFKLRDGQIEEGSELFAKRHPSHNRKVIPYENSQLSNLISAERIFLMEEQGVGDQVALIPMAAKALQKIGVTNITYIGEDRVVDTLADNGLGISFMSRSDFDIAHVNAKPNELVFVGDICRHIKDLGLWDTGEFGAYIHPDAGSVADLRAKYEEAAGGRPIIGISWKSMGSMSGYLRSVQLEEILSQLPEDAYIVSLQYGENDKEIRKARKRFPGMTIVTDPTINQMSDLRSFAAQILALQHVITIDNTTAHMAGGVGHTNTDVLVPSGSECMWYWGPKGSHDRWYGVLNIRRSDTGSNLSSAIKDI